MKRFDGSARNPARLRHSSVTKNNRAGEDKGLQRLRQFPQKPCSLFFILAEESPAYFIISQTKKIYKQMVHELYKILSTYVTSGLFLAYGLVFLFTLIPDGPLMGNYRKARYAIAGAYLFFAAVEMLELAMGSGGRHSLALMQAITIAIAASQSFLFTFAMLALVDVHFPGWRYIFREAVPALLLIAIVLLAYAFCSEACFGFAFYGFALIYTLLMVRYTFLFLRGYRLFRRRMDNYYSDEEAGRLRWVAFSFFAALAIGVMALLTSVFMSTVVALSFTLIFDTFYTLFAIRFLNYPHLFQRELEHVMEDEKPDAAPAESDAKSGGEAFALLEKRIELWVADKEFRQQGITVDALASRLFTNPKYISTYINKHKKQTFRKWINELRIEEAKVILTREPDTTLTDVAHRTGYADKSHFLRQFKELNGVSPTEWRRQVR
jgi:AraC-like DNA-binding protein